jgi:hypothetical protein
MPEGSKKKDFFLLRLLRMGDQFGRPVEWTIAGDTTYNSALGGVFSLFTCFVMIIYFVVEIQKL